MKLNVEGLIGTRPSRQILESIEEKPPRHLVELPQRYIQEEVFSKGQLELPPDRVWMSLDYPGYETRFYYRCDNESEAVYMRLRMMH